jgi:hypothetical protein
MDDRLRHNHLATGNNYLMADKGRINVMPMRQKLHEVRLIRHMSMNG